MLTATKQKGKQVAMTHEGITECYLRWLPLSYYVSFVICSNGMWERPGVKNVCCLPSLIFSHGVQLHYDILLWMAEQSKKQLLCPLWVCVAGDLTYNTMNKTWPCTRLERWLQKERRAGGACYNDDCFLALFLNTNKKFLEDQIKQFQKYQCRWRILFQNYCF